MALTHEEQAVAFLRLVKERKGPINPGTQVFDAVTRWLGLPLEISETKRREILAELSIATGMTGDALWSIVTTKQVDRLNDPEQKEVYAPVFTNTNTMKEKISLAKEREAELYALIPKDGFFRRYAEYTWESEAPLSYHLFCAVAGLAATVNRRVFLDMGNHKLYPPFGVFILGNSGIKKTSAGDIIVSLLRESALTPIYAEKLTPEALIDGMRGGNATGLVYAPEMTVLISKQKYMESIIPLLTRFMDSPDVWNSGTIMRGKVELKDVAITCIMCSTLDWFMKNTPEALFGGGFIARNLMIMQEVSGRIKALPPPENKDLRRTLLIDLARLFEFQGQVTLAPDTRQAFERWYTENKYQALSNNELFETYFARKHSHLLRLAIILHLGTHWDLIVCKECFERAKKWLEWTESQFDLLHGKMFKSVSGEEQDLVMRTIERNGGDVSWTKLLRTLSYKLSSHQLRIIVMNLKEQERLEEINTTLGHRIRFIKRGEE